MYPLGFPPSVCTSIKRIHCLTIIVIQAATSSIFDPLHLHFQEADNNSSSSFPVLVLLHDGDWSSGSAQGHNAPKLAAQGLVVVTLNYRLGMLSELFYIAIK